MRRGMILENSDYLEISDANQVKHAAPSSQKTSIGIHFDLYQINYLITYVCMCLYAIYKYL